MLLGRTRRAYSSFIPVVHGVGRVALCIASHARRSAVEAGHRPDAVTRFACALQVLPAVVRWVEVGMVNLSRWRDSPRRAVFAQRHLCQHLMPELPPGCGVESQRPAIGVLCPPHGWFDKVAIHAALLSHCLLGYTPGAVAVVVTGASSIPSIAFRFSSLRASLLSIHPSLIPEL